jgi:enoyl-CoA hydratase/carnithine racemase
MADIIVERRGAIQLITINRDHVRNAIDAASAIVIDSALNAADADDIVALSVITGAGSRAFCSGMDMKEAAEKGIGRGFVADRGFAGITQARRNKPLIAAVNGAAVAGGFEISLACDLVFAAEHAVFGLSEIKRGLYAFAGGIQRLARRLPRATGMAAILTGEALTARRLFDLGAVTEVVGADRLMERTLEVAAQIAGYAPDAIRGAKQLFDMAEDAPLEQSLRFGAAIGHAGMRASSGPKGVEAYLAKTDQPGGILPKKG